LIVPYKDKLLVPDQHMIAGTRLEQDFWYRINIAGIRLEQDFWYRINTAGTELEQSIVDAYQLMFYQVCEGSNKL
jgi:hypothetical protein